MPAEPTISRKLPLAVTAPLIACPLGERMETVEFQESNSITFEWTLRGLKTLFESRCVLSRQVLSGSLTPTFQQGRCEIESNEEY